MEKTWSGGGKMRVRNLNSELKFSFNHKYSVVGILGKTNKQTNAETLKVRIMPTDSTTMCIRFVF